MSTCKSTKPFDSVYVMSSSSSGIEPSMTQKYYRRKKTDMRWLLPYVKDVSPTQVRQDTADGVIDWVFPNDDTTHTVHMNESGVCLEEEEFPNGKMVAFAHDCDENDTRFGMVLKRLTRNGWYVVLNEEGHHELVGNVWMESL